MAPLNADTWQPSVDPSSPPETCSSNTSLKKTQDADSHCFERRDSGYESSIPLSNTPQHRKANSAAPNAITNHSPREYLSRSRTDTTLMRQSTRRSSMSPSESSSHRCTTSHHTHSSRSSVAPSNGRGSKHSSCRTSFLLQSITQPPNSRPPIHNRAITAGNIHLQHNPFLPLHDTVAPVHSSPRAVSFPLRSPPEPVCFPCFPPAASPRKASSYTNYVPATTVDWTLPSTRKLEYEEIDRQCRGLRGLWRKFMPKFCQRNRRAGFSNDKDVDQNSDAGSVRRYRLDTKDEDEDEGNDSGEEEDVGDEKKEIGSKPVLKSKKVTSGWSCWGLKRDSGTGSEG